MIAPKMQLPPEGQPPHYAAYPRSTPGPYGTPDKLRALSEGYFGLNLIFGLNIALALGTMAIPAPKDLATLLAVAVGVRVVIALVIGFATYPHNKKIGYGANWSSYWPAVASILIALNSALCCGIIGYVVMQQLASNEMRKYGLKVGFGGIRKKDVELKIAEMESHSRVPGPIP
jgi:hypothetical protein